jgi:hypothetical protein
MLKGQLQLQECKHIIEMTGLDAWVRSQIEGITEAIVQLTCPQCKTTIRCTERFGGVLKQRQIDIERV